MPGTAVLRSAPHDHAEPLRRLYRVVDYPTSAVRLLIGGSTLFGKPADQASAAPFAMPPAAAGPRDRARRLLESKD